MRHERTIPLVDLAQARYAVSPVWELVVSLRVLQSPSTSSIHANWRESTLRRVRSARLDLSRLFALVPPTGHIADFLTPPPVARSSDIETDLEHIGRTKVSDMLHDLDLLSSSTNARQSVLDEARRDPQAFLRAIRADLLDYWQIALADVWPRLSGLAESDISWRLDLASSKGPKAGFAHLHPRIELRGSDVIVSSTCRAEHPAATGTGLVLVPCAFAWPEILLLDKAGHTTTLAYAPRGIGTLWRQQEGGTRALSRLIGGSRTRILRVLDLPATNAHLASQLRLSQPTTNTHLRILLQAGAVSRRRRGRSVYYARTRMGELLLAGDTDAWPSSTHSIDA